MKGVDRCHAIEDEDSIKMIKFVLDSTGLETLRPERCAQAFHHDPLRASDVGGDVWET